MKNRPFMFFFRNVPNEKRTPLVAKAKEIIEKSGFKVGLAHCALGMVSNKMNQFKKATNLQ